MDSESRPPPSVVKCCNCGCTCSSLISSSSEGTWLRSVKRKHNEFETGSRFFIPGFEVYNVARVQVETECAALRETVSSQQQAIQDLYLELEEERSASSSAANEAMSMILRLQREKAEIQMEARQFKRFAEEKTAHDQQELSAMEDLLYKREQAIQSLTCEVQAYKHRMLSYGLTESEAEGERGGHSRNQSTLDNSDAQDEFSNYDYPPIRCNTNEFQSQFEVDNDAVDIEKYAFGETPQDHLKNLECRIGQMERSHSVNHLDGEFSGGKNILEKVVVGQSPRCPRHARRYSADSMNSFLGIIKENGSDIAAEYPMRNNSFKKMDHFSHPEDYNPRKLDNVSEVEDDMISDRVYTIDSIQTEVPYNDFTETKAGIGICEDYMTTSRESQDRIDVSDPDVKKLYMRLQALEADRESMKQALISMRTDKAQLVLLKEIAQQLCRDMSPDKRLPVQKPTVVRSIPFVSIFKWVVSFIFWRKKALQSKYAFGLSPNNRGLLMLLDKNPNLNQRRCLVSTQV